jgi:uncharacterized protein YkwD
VRHRIRIPRSPTLLTVALLTATAVLATISSAAAETEVTAPLPAERATAVVPSGAIALVNYYRAQAGLPSVTEKASLSSGDVAHAKYMVKNHYLGHDETPGQPFYTAAGDAAAGASNVMRGAYGTSARSAVDSWITGPFHGIGILDPRLAKVGYGSYKEHMADPFFSFAAALNVISELTAIPDPADYPVRYPSAGKTTYLASYGGGESPDPLTPCAGYSAPTGAPIMLQVAAPGAVNASSFSQAGTPLDFCIYDGTTYTNPDLPLQGLARSILSSRNAIVVIPKESLRSQKTYDVSVTVGATPISWSFKVGDIKPPVTQIVKPISKSYARRNLRKFTGTTTGGARRVDVSLAKFIHATGGCKFWTGSKWVSKSCQNQVWLKATGTSSWYYHPSIKLPDSTNKWNYLLWAKSRDRVGNIDDNFAVGRNYVGFGIH